jgi:hypothetical protein
MKMNNDYLQKHDFLGLKRFSRKFRIKGINLNKTPLYNDRNKKRLLKGTGHKKNSTLLAGWKILKDA